ncbi:MAG TPA: winged helix-turn-helix domain-containing protein [Nocardioides sp.]|jgi:DNA-binding response OmpR family regulator|nr:winged helix-turn-helix domain-containing protein [Nocardioides sp.]
MTVTTPHSRDGTRLPESFTVCVSSSAEERSRVAAALDAQGLLVLVPDAQMAVDLLLRAAEQGDGDHAQPDGRVRLGRLEVDRSRATVTWGQRQVEVSHLELEVLACLAATPGVVWTYERLHDAAWGTRYVGDRDSVYSLVKRLRRKLSDAGVELDLLAVRGIGFQLVPRTPTAVEAAPLTEWEPEAG